ncbi:NAD(P)-binding protein [Cadophora sp. DSE1049]|nr:NAD(P)-binding protein [Cadophora sp. DSE1049]
MGLNILITGAAGYIGGTVLADFIARTDGPIKDSKISAAVRTPEQVQALAKLGVNVIQVDLTDEAAVLKAALDNQIDLVVHTATSMDTRQPSNLISALGQSRKLTGEDKYFIHTSVTTMYSVEGGWPFGEIEDTDHVYEKEIQIEKGNPVRDLNIFVVEHAKSLGVMSFIVPVPFVYGIGTGEWRKLCVHLPSHIRAFIKHKKVYIFDKEGSPPAAHVTDVASFYGLLTEHILRKETIPSGKNGYYFITAHTSPWWSVMQRVGDALYARGLVTEAKPHTWPSDEMAAEALGLPLLYIRAIETSSGDMIGINAQQLGWKPKWNQDRYLNNMDVEVKGVLEMDEMKPSLLQKLLESEKSA